MIVRIGQRILMLTAGHVWTDFQEGAGGKIFAAVSGSFVSMAGQLVRSNAFDERGDRFDAAVLLVDEGEEADRLMINAMPWGISDIGGPPSEGEQVLLFGFPHKDAERTNGRRVEPRLSMWETVIGKRDSFEALGLSQDEHIVAVAPLGAVVRESGLVGRSVSPSGVSGSGMWLLPSKGPARLAAIFTEARDDVFIGTPVVAHSLLIRHWFRDVFAQFATA